MSSSIFSAFGSKGYDFMIPSTSGKSPNEIKIMLLINNDNSWSSMKISYLASARQDLYTGSFMVNGLSFYGREREIF